VVLYEGGKEVDRLPRKKANGGVVKGRWTAADVARSRQTSFVPL
jgi:hypothetical protein